MNSYRNRQHDWKSPPAGQGGGKMCTKCGTRQRPDNVTSECGGVDVPDAVMPTEVNYDPFSE